MYKPEYRVYKGYLYTPWESDAVWFSLVSVPSSTLLLFGFVLLFIPLHLALSGVTVGSRERV